MSTDSLPSTASPQPFRLEMRPHRSLSPGGFLAVMAFTTIVSFVTGLAFTLMGAWPVMGFFGLDVILVYWAFKANYRSGRRSETIEIADGRLSITRNGTRGDTDVTALLAAWVDVRLRTRAGGATELALASHGREHRIADFLSNDERREVATLLRAAVLDARGGARI